MDEEGYIPFFEFTTDGSPEHNRAFPENFGSRI